jgi:hypothetical protein
LLKTVVWPRNEDWTRLDSQDIKSRYPNHALSGVRHGYADVG